MHCKIATGDDYDQFFTGNSRQVLVACQFERSFRETVFLTEAAKSNIRFHPLLNPPTSNHLFVPLFLIGLQEAENSHR